MSRAVRVEFTPKEARELAAQLTEYAAKVEASPLPDAYGHLMFGAAVVGTDSVVRFRVGKGQEVLL